MLLRKRPSHIEVYNDLDGDVVNFFRVLQDKQYCADLCSRLALTPYARAEYDLAHENVNGESSDDRIERARRLVIRAYMGYGSNAGTRRHKCGFRGSDWSARQANNKSWPLLPENICRAARRLIPVVIENRPALDLISAQDSEETLFYLDPPYVHSARVSFAKDRSYRHEMTDEGHIKLSEKLKQAKGYVVISGYRTVLYDELYNGWYRKEKRALTQGNAKTIYRTECIWLSPRTQETLAYDLFK